MAGNKNSGRATEYNEEIAKEICNKISSSSKSTKNLCIENPHWPSEDTIYHWRHVNRIFSEEFRQAKSAQAEVYVEELIAISDECDKDILMNTKGDPVVNSAAVARAKLKSDTRKWIASKLIPKVYGDKQIVDQLKEESEAQKQEILTLRKQLEEAAKRDY